MTKQQQFYEYQDNGGSMTIEEWEMDGRYDKSAENKINYWKNDEDQCIGGIVVIPEGNGIRIYVAWEWEAAVEDGRIKFYKSWDVEKNLNASTIKDAMNRGLKVAREEAEIIFPQFFKSLKPHQPLFFYD